MAWIDLGAGAGSRGLEEALGRILDDRFESLRRSLRKDFESVAEDLLATCHTGLGAKAKPNAPCLSATPSPGQTATFSKSPGLLPGIVASKSDADEDMLLPGMVQLHSIDPSAFTKSRSSACSPPVAKAKSAGAAGPARNSRVRPNRLISSEMDRSSLTKPRKSSAEAALSRIAPWTVSKQNMCPDEIVPAIGGGSHGVVPTLPSRSDDSAKEGVGGWCRSSMHSAGLRQLSTVRPKIRKAVDSAAFDFLSMFLIISNAVTIGFQTEFMAREKLSVTPSEYAAVELIYLVLFTAELIVRFSASGWILFDFRTGPGRWAIFDLTVVTLQFVEIAVTYSLRAASNGNLGFLRVMRVLRLIRILRVVRIVQFLGELRTIVASIMNSMRALLWTLVLLLLGIYVVGVYFTQLVLDYRVQMRAEVAAEVAFEADAAVAASSPMCAEDEDGLVKYFGDLPRAILSLFQAMSGGVDWDAMCSPLIEKISPIQGLIFVGYIAFTVLALLNVVTGVFVEGSLKRAKMEEQSYYAVQLHNMFIRATSEEGRLSAGELKEQLSNSEMRRFLKEIDVDIDEAHALFYILDSDGSGSINCEEFVFGCLRLRGTARAIDFMMLSHQLQETMKDNVDQREAMQEALEEIQGTLRDFLSPSGDPICARAGAGIGASLGVRSSAASGGGLCAGDLGGLGPGANGGSGLSAGLGLGAQGL